jgi:NitT/TauT family transport system permease protein
MPTNEPDVLGTEADDFAGLDALDVPIPPAPGRARRLWSSTWPQAAAIGVALVAWQIVAWTHLKPAWILPGPVPVLRRLGSDITSFKLLHAMATTMRRAVVGYGLAVVIGSILGLVVSRSRTVRTAIGSLITGLQTMPTIAWFPLAILLFGLNETAILFVVVLGAAPAIANGLISGVDHIPPLWLRAGRVLGARGIGTYRHIVLPAALPGFVAGLKQGWAFAWRSLMAGELLVIIAARPSLGVNLQLARENADAPALLATMVAILVIGIVIDSLFFARFEVAIRRRRGLTVR